MLHITQLYMRTGSSRRINSDRVYENGLRLSDTAAAFHVFNFLIDVITLIFNSFKSKTILFITTSKTFSITTAKKESMEQYLYCQGRNYRVIWQNVDSKNKINAVLGKQHL